MLVPDPADRIGRVVLVLRKPEFAFFADDVEDLEDKHNMSAKGSTREIMNRIGEVRE